MTYVDGDYNDPGHLQGAAQTLGDARSAPRTTSRSRRACSPTVVEGLGVVRLREERARHRREAVRPRPEVGAGAQPRPPLGVPRARHLPDRPLPRQGGDPEHPLLPLRQLVPRADLEPQLRAPGADHDGRGLRRAGAGQVLRGGRRAARRRAEPPAPDGRRCSRWSRRSARTSRTSATRRRRCSARCERLKPDDLVRGQFDGYRDEDGVAPDSDVETFAAVRLHIDSWRWAGVPFYIRAGKNLPVTCTEVRVELHRPPQRCSPSTRSCRRDTNYLRFRLNPAGVRSRSARGRRARRGLRRATTSSSRSPTTTPTR